MISLATSPADAAAVEAVEQHHAELLGSLTVHVERLVDAASHADPDEADRARGTLIRWAREELLPHARAEEEAIYPPAHAMAEGRLLVTGMLGEHRALSDLLTTIETSRDPVRMATHATALQELFRSHLRKENELLLPLLAGSRDVSIADLLQGMHELLGGPTDHTADTPASGHSCTCGELEPSGHPELDARDIPHAIRHATIFGALETVTAGNGLVLVAPHDPLPLLAQVEQRWPGRFDVSYLDQGPDAWRLLFLHDGPEVPTAA